MADIFISYARKDDTEISRVRPIAEALEALGYEVFWDKKIPPGAEYDEYLERQLEIAKSVLVLWSSVSRQSRWVKEEASYARDNRKLLPACLDGSKPPLGFTSIQTVDLSSWNGEFENDGWQSLMIEISRRCGPAALRGASRVTGSSPWHIVLVIDDSGSMVGAISAAINDSLAAMVEEMQLVSQGVKPYFRISLISYGNYARVVCEALRENDVRANHVRVFSGSSGGSNTAAALVAARRLLLRYPGNQNDFVPYVFLLTDGIDADAYQAIVAAEALKQTELPCGFPCLVTLGFGDSDRSFLSKIASHPKLFKEVGDTDAIARLFPAIGTSVTSAGGTRGIDRAIMDI